MSEKESGRFFKRPVSDFDDVYLILFFGAFLYWTLYNTSAVQGDKRASGVLPLAVAAVAALALFVKRSGRLGSWLRRVSMMPPFVFMIASGALSYIERVAHIDGSIEVFRGALCCLGLVWGGAVGMGTLRFVPPCRVYKIVFGGSIVCCVLYFVGMYLPDQVVRLANIFLPACLAGLLCLFRGSLRGRDKAAAPAVVDAASSGSSGVLRVFVAVALTWCAQGVIYGCLNGALASGQGPAPNDDWAWGPFVDVVPSGIQPIVDMGFLLGFWWLVGHGTRRAQHALLSFMLLGVVVLGSVLLTLDSPYGTAVGSLLLLGTMMLLDTLTSLLAYSFGIRSSHGVAAMFGIYQGLGRFLFFGL